MEKRVEKLREVLTEVSSSVRKPPIRSFVIEALIDGDSELHITQEGIYWKQHGTNASKPGRFHRRNEPTYVNGKPWMPTWGKPKEESGDDRTAILPLPIGELRFGFEIIAIGDRPRMPGIQQRSPVTIQNEQGEQVLSIPDKEAGSKWYTIRLFRLK